MGFAWGRRDGKEEMILPTLFRFNEHKKKKKKKKKKSHEHNLIA